MTTSLGAAQLRAVLLFGLFLGALPACTQAPKASSRKVVAQFTGTMDQKTGTLTMSRAPVGLPGGPQVAFGPITDGNDGTAGSGQADTVELVTEGAVRTGQAGCGRADSICADVTLRSFFAGNELHNVFVEITSVSSGSNLGFSNTADPTGGQPGTGAVTSASGALWAYPALLDSTRGTIGGAAPGANAATRTWYFNNAGNTAFTFTGRVMADVTGVATGLQALCGAVPTRLNTVTNCGECLRSAPVGTTCNYANVEGSTQATSRLDVAVLCSSGTACDTGSSTAFTCNNLQAEASNCGVCGNSCGGNGCVAGVCTNVAACTTGTRCGTVCCPGGSTCTTGLCILSAADSLSVGAEAACVTTGTTSRIPYQAVTGTPTQPNNVVCWGKSWFPSPVSPSFSAGVPVPEYNDPGSAVHSGMSGVSAGGTAAYAYYLAADALDGWGTLPTWAGSNSVDGFGVFGASTLAAGGDHVCAMGVNFINCIGANGSGQLGINSQTDMGPPYNLVLGVGGSPSRLIATSMSAAGDSTCAVLGPPSGPDGSGQTAGTVACWGANTNGKAGGTGGPYLVPRLVEATTGSELAGISAVSVGANHTVALTNGGDLVFWGLNNHGQFGASTALAPNLVTAVSTGGRARAVSAGQDFTCYLRDDATIWCTGVNGRGQLGNNSTAESTVFTRVTGLSGAASVSAGGVPKTGNPAFGSACARVGGNVYCWGDNSSGQVGAGTGTGFYTTPQLVQLQPLP